MNIDTWKEMMSGGSKNTPKVISQLIEALKAIDDDEYLNQVTMLSARQKDLKKNLMQGLVTDSEAQVHQNKINNALLFSLDELDDDNIFTEEKQTQVEKAAFSIPTSTGDNLSAPTIEELKKTAKDTQSLLFSLQNEKDMTLPGKAEVIIQRQIDNAEKELESLKTQIQTLKA